MQNNGFSVREIVEKSVIESRKKDREEWEQRGWFSSGLGNCLSGRYYERLSDGKEEIDPRKAMLFSVGDAFHEWVYRKVRDSGIRAVFEESLEDEALHMVGRLDMRLEREPRIWTVYDIKTVHSKSFWWREKNGNSAQPQHILQLTAYLMMLKAKYPKLTFEGRLLYISKDDLVMQEVDVPYDGKNVAYITQTLTTLNDAWEKKVAPPHEPDVVSESGKWVVNWKSRYCLYHHLCTGNADWLEKAKEEATRKNQETIVHKEE